MVKILIEVKNITKKYGGSAAVKDISFSAKKGEIIGLLGPNGAGKTTTLNILTGCLKANEGTVLINGFDIDKEPEKAKADIGYLPDVPPLYPEMTVFEYLRFVAEIRRVKKADLDKEVKRVINLAELTTLEDKLIKTLSKGFKQRVGLAQAVVGSPKIIILDEPSSGLDPKQITEMRDIIKNLGKRHTVLLSSHILHEVSAVCDRIIIINKGQIAAMGTMDELSERMLAGSKIFVKIKGNLNSVKAVFESLSENFTISKSDKSGISDVVFKGTTSEVLREQIFKTASQNNLTIIELTPVAMSLEDVFLEVTEGKIC